MSPLMIAAALLSTLSAVLALFLLRAVDTQTRLAARIAMVQRSAGLGKAVRAKPTSGIVRLVSTLGLATTRSGMLSPKTLSDLQQTLILSGYRSSSGLGIFVGSKLILLTCLPLIAWIALGRLGTSPLLHNCGTLAAGALGLLLPDLAIKRVRSRYLKRLAHGLPDALDMMVICSEAGLGLEPSISRVAIEIAHTHPAVSAELHQTASELRIISDRRIALQNMGNRTGLEGLKRLAATLVQTMQYGTPVSYALRTLSTEMRTETLTQFEERAAKLPVLLTVPMIVFILPTVFVVVGGPAMLGVMAVMHH